MVLLILLLAAATAATTVLLSASSLPFWPFVLASIGLLISDQSHLGNTNFYNINSIHFPLRSTAIKKLLSRISLPQSLTEGLVAFAAFMLFVLLVFTRQ